MSYYGGKRDGVDLSEFNKLTRELTPYGTYREPVESNPELIGYNRYSYGTKQDYAKSEADSGRFLHTGGGNETLRDLGLALERAQQGKNPQRDYGWFDSLIPNISGRANIIPKIKQAQSNVSQKIQERNRLIQKDEFISSQKEKIKSIKENLSKAEKEREARGEQYITGYRTEMVPVTRAQIVSEAGGKLPTHQARYQDPNAVIFTREAKYPIYATKYKDEDTQIVNQINQELQSSQSVLDEYRKINPNIIDQKEEAMLAVEAAKNTGIKAPRFTPRQTWGPAQGFYNNEYDYEMAQKNINIATAESQLADLEKQEKNFKADIDDAQNLNKLLKEYEKEKRFEFLNDYESRSGGVMSMGGPDAPALTPTGSMRYKSRSDSSGFKAITFEAPQPFEAKPMPRQTKQYEDRIMREMKVQQIPFKNDFGLATRKEKRFNAKRFFG